MSKVSQSDLGDNRRSAALMQRLKTGFLHSTVICSALFLLVLVGLPVVYGGQARSLLPLRQYVVTTLELGAESQAALDQLGQGLFVAHGLELLRFGSRVIGLLAVLFWASTLAQTGILLLLSILFRDEAVIELNPLDKAMANKLLPVGLGALALVGVGAWISPLESLSLDEITVVVLTSIGAFVIVALGVQWYHWGLTVASGDAARLAVVEFLTAPHRRLPPLGQRHGVDGVPAHCIRTPNPMDVP